MTVKVHEFSDTTDAYDSLQTDDGISNGDVLVVVSERVVGIALEAWPVALTPEQGAFHKSKPDFDWSSVKQYGSRSPRDYSESVKVAQAIIAEYGFDAESPTPSA